jgi:hypothetical protein
MATTALGIIAPGHYTGPHFTIIRQRYTCFTFHYYYCVSLKKLRPLPPAGELRQHFIYNPDTGIITKTGQTREAGFIHPTGYRLICYKHEGKWINIWAHRLAFILHTGLDPYPLEVDHINRDRQDNRIINLRTATRSENCRNCTPRPKKQRRPRTSVCVYRNLDRWTVIIKGVYYGHTDTFEEGIILRNKIIEELNLNVLITPAK